jgi:phospholipid transport system substrate-binding protein
MRIVPTAPVAAVLAIMAAARVVAQAQSPTATLRKVNVEVDKLLKKKTSKGSPADKKVKEDIKALAAGLLDYDELSQQALKRHWAEMSGPQRTDFVKVFKELIERNYVKQIRTGVDYGIIYKDEKVDGQRADVKTVVRTKRKGRMADTVVDYKLLRRAAKWRVWDIITDEDEYSSLVMNYRSEFNKLWAKDGFEGVMKKIRTKLAESDE